MQTNEVIVYTLDTCLQCIQLKAWLRKNSISFIQKDIKHSYNLDELNTLGSNTVPFIQVKNLITNNTILINEFNKSTLSKVLELNAINI